MTKDTGAVAKARILVDDPGGETQVLLSVKNAPGELAHGKLEMPGGHLEEGETPREAVIRELAEEEQTGLLSKKILEECPNPIKLDADGATHYLFEVCLAATETGILRHDPKESLGFVTLPLSEFKPDDERLTWRTRMIVGELKDS